MTPRARGFTLVEVLLAIGIAAVVLVETAAIFRAAVGSHRRLTDTTLASAALQDALDLIARDVQRLIVPSDPSVPSVEGASDGGVTRVLRLRVASPAAVVDYFLYDDGPVRLLVRRHEPIRDGIGDADAEPVAWEVVARDVAAFQVRCFDGAAWTDIGPAAGVPPRLAEVKMAVRGGDGGVITASRIVTPAVGEPPAGVTP